MIRVDCIYFELTAIILISQYLEIESYKLTPHNHTATVNNQTLDKLQSLSSRIIGGDNAKFGEFPFEVSLVNKKNNHQHFCCGSLVSVKNVLTSCHCFINYKSGVSFKTKAEEIGIVAGVINLEDVDNAQYEDAAELKVHWKCKNVELTWIYDYGIAIVSQPFQLIPKRVELLPIPRFDISTLDSWSEKRVNCTAIGWGAIGLEAELSPDLLKVELTLEPPPICEKWLGPMGGSEGGLYSPQLHLCARSGSTKDTCEGDSGSPLLCGDKLQPIAVCSFGIGCGEVGVPGIYARLDIVESWLRTYLEGSDKIKPSPEEEYVDSSGPLDVVSDWISLALIVIHLEVNRFKY